jgi:hypothetical protein
MDQAEIAYKLDAQVIERTERECKSAQVNEPNKDATNNEIVDQTLLQMLVFALNSIFN